MVYVEPGSMGWRPMAASWLHDMPAPSTAGSVTAPAAAGATAITPSALTSEHKERLNALMGWLVDPCIAFVRKNCKEGVATADINLAVSLMGLVTSLCDEFRAEKCPVSNPEHFAKLD